MGHQFKKHYTRDEARMLMPTLRKWLEQLSDLHVELATVDQRMEGLMAGGNDTGGNLVNQSLKLHAEIQALFQEFRDREIFIKDLERGLVDFPALIGGREVFLCWEKDEDDVEFWHDIDSGYAGREPIQ